MDVKVTPSALRGRLPAISSKSDVHRLLICAALSDRPCKINFSGLSDDILATISCLRALGAQIDAGVHSISVIPILHHSSIPQLDCRECGSTARFLLPLAAALHSNFSMNGHGGLQLRPFTSLCAQMEAHGCSLSSHNLPLECWGKLQSGQFELSGDISSQYFTGLLLSLPLLCGDSTISLLSPLQSRGYVDMTLETLRIFGVSVTAFDDRFEIKGAQKYISPLEITADGDWSNSAFWLCGAAINGDISLDMLSQSSLQGDKQIVDILQMFGADITCNSSVSSKKRTLSACRIDASQIPDLVPAIAAVAALSEGRTEIYNAARLRIKESDRLQSTYALIHSLGGEISIVGDSLIITGVRQLVGGVVDSFNDHRIAMAAAVASCGCKSDVIIKNASAVNKSYPDFFKHFNLLGGKCNVI